MRQTALAGEPFLAMGSAVGRLKVYHDVYADSDALQSQCKLCAVAWAIPMKSLQTVEQPGAGSPIRPNHISNDSAWVCANPLAGRH